jgi:hypothetical protein
MISYADLPPYSLAIVDFDPIGPYLDLTPSTGLDRSGTVYEEESTI